MEFLIPNKTRESFSKWADIAPRPYKDSLDDLSCMIELESRSWENSTDRMAPAKNTERLFKERLTWTSQDQRTILEVALMAKLALKTPSLVKRGNLPDSILAFYPAAFDRMAVVLREKAEKPFDQTINLLVKYIRFVLALTIPCGAEVVELNSRIPLSSAVLSVSRELSLRTLIRYFRCGGTGIWFRKHTDTENLEEFNEEGFDRYYRRVAELLIRRKHIRGLVGTSWFHDPQVLDVSPRLSYLQQRPLERGAFLMRHRVTKEDIERATRTSSTRRCLYQEGKYTPVSYSLIWGRKELISWATKTV